MALSANQIKASVWKPVSVNSILNEVGVNLFSKVFNFPVTVQFKGRATYSNYVLLAGFFIVRAVKYYLMKTDGDYEESERVAFLLSQTVVSFVR